MAEQIPAVNAAQAASRRSAEYVSRGNREAWLALFAEDAVVQDPVGVSPLDPSGEGHRGQAAIADFWQQTIAGNAIAVEILSSHPAGEECANVVSLHNRMASGAEFRLQMVVVYRANVEGKIVSLKAYWDFNALLQQLAS